MKRTLFQSLHSCTRFHALLYRDRITACTIKSVPLVLSSRFSSDNLTKHDYFSIFQLSHKFTIDDKDLKAAYKNLMTDLHPDKAFSRDEAKIGDEELTASAVTHAYSVISKPHLRAMHLLELKGMPLDENDGGDLVGGEFLMEVMMIRETIDDANDDKELKQLLEENQERIYACCVALDDAFQNKENELAKRLAAKLQYWNRVEGIIKEKMDGI